MDEIRIIKEKIDLNELKAIAKEHFGDMVKAVVDLDIKIMAIGAGMHADEEAVLLQQGSKQENLWGINLYVDMPKEQFVEFDSMINIRPRQNNRTRGVEDENIRKQIIEAVNNLILWN